MILYNEIFYEFLNNFLIIHKLLLIDFWGAMIIHEIASFGTIVLPIMYFSFLMVFDIISYFLGFLLSKIKPKNWIYDKKNLFYIYFRMIPFIGGIGVFLGTFLSSEINIKKDFKKIILGNFIFLFYATAFSFIIAMIFGIPGID